MTGEKPGADAGGARKTVITLTPSTVSKVLGGLVAILIVASSLGQLVRFTMETGHRHGLVRLFYVGSECNIPTWYSASALRVRVAAEPRRSGEVEGAGRLQTLLVDPDRGVCVPLLR